MAAEWLDQLRTAEGAGPGGDFFTQFVILRRESDRLRSKAWRLAAWPILTLTGGLAAMAVGMAIVVPELKHLYETAGLRPTSASSLAFEASDQGKAFWLMMSISLLTLGHAPWILRQTAEHLLSKTVLFGPTWRAIEEADWSRTTALFLSVGKSLPQSMRLADEFVGGGDAAMLDRYRNDRLDRDLSEASSTARQLQLSSKWGSLLENDASLAGQLSTLQRLAADSAARAATQLTLLRAAIWPAAGLALLLLTLALGNAVCQPVLAYLRSWA